MKNRKGVSEIVGYVLLISIVIVISIFVYQWLKSYVPQQQVSCPDGVSVAVTNFVYDCAKDTLNFTLSNTGTFSIAGYFIHASNNSNDQIAATDLTPYYIKNSQASIGNLGGVIFTCTGQCKNLNVISPGNEINLASNGFNLSVSPSIPSSPTNHIQWIEIIPLRYVEYNNRGTFASCTNSKIRVPIQCS
ncbi:MAG: hypothetical protein KGH55_01340 [Nanoarchaeota archaeon]|nr:hypothetical protein [Nanoarchaeota archaeon]